MMNNAAEKKIQIAIVGGGFCGVMTAVHLLSQQKTPLHIILINAQYPLTKGVAYSSYSNKHLLNVAAKNMSAFPDKPRHFLDWLSKHEKYGALDQVALPEKFLPRNIYGYYIKDIFEKAIRKKHSGVSIEFVHDTAIDMKEADGRYIIHFSVSPPVHADKVVIAIGNQAPRPLQSSNSTFLLSKKYFPNPWMLESVNHSSALKSVLILGNGLTMVDTVIGLLENGFKGKIYSLSPHGFKTLPHRDYEPYKELVHQLKPPFDLLGLIQLFRKHVNVFKSKNMTAEAVVDSLRSKTQEIWQQLSMPDKKRFLFAIRHVWGIARHRLPMEVHEKIQAMVLDESLEIIAGRIHSIAEIGEKVHVIIEKRSDKQKLAIDVDRVINCTGPESDIRKMENTFIQNLVSRKFIFSDELNLGISATANGNIILSDGSVSENLLTIGSLLKGILWESTAVPELRAQAKNLANNILSKSEAIALP